jgi:hypothetical protein
MHKLEQLIDDCLKELPMSLEEAGVLSDDVHNVTGDNGLVVFASLHLSKTEEVLNDSNKEPLLCLFVHRQRDRADSPAKNVAVVPRPLASVDLSSELLGHDVFCVDHVQMCQVDQALSNRLVKLYRVTLLDEFSDDFTLVVLNNQDFLGTDHLLDHNDSKVREDLVVFVLSERVVIEHCRVRGAAARHSCANCHKRVKVGHGELLHLLVKLLDKLEPIVEANLENFSIIDLRYPNKIVVTVNEEIAVGEFLDKLSQSC